MIELTGMSQLPSRCHVLFGKGESKRDANSRIAFICLFLKDIFAGNRSGGTAIWLAPAILAAPSAGPGENVPGQRNGRSDRQAHTDATMPAFFRAGISGLRHERGRAA
ncbi:MAG: hypothetical protein ACK4ZN_01175 [Oceanibaculum sp.]